MKVGDTFHAPLPPHNNPHLFVAISDPAQDSEHVVIVPFMSLDEDDDTQETVCTLVRGDHPFIRHPSFVNFDCARAPSAVVIRERSTGPGKPVSAALLARILQGAGKSTRMPLHCRDILESQGLIEAE
jgi:hypothetical protein